MIFKEKLFKDKNILITGASSGLGLQVSKDVTDLNSALTGVSRSIELNDFLQKTNPIDGSKVNVVPLDFTDNKLSFDDFKQLPAFDAVFFSAGLSIVSNFAMTSDETIDHMFNVNVVNQLKLLRFLIKKKKINKGASIVFMSSVNGTTIGSKGHSIYAATKGALNGATKSLSNELSKKRIRVNSIAAGLVKTPMYFENLKVAGEHSMKEYENSYPLGFGDPQDVSNLVIFLFSEASSWITGQTLTIDGGLSIS